MSSQYSRDHCKIAVGKILQTIGWHSINSTPLEVLTDIMSKYIQQISKITMDYANEFGNTEPNLDHLGLAFQEMGISLSELEEYVTYVNFVPGPNPTPKFPIPKENNLNFLKPGSKEVVTRPVHVHEHLPPMHPLLEGTENEVEDVKVKQEELEESPIDVVGTQHFKKPADVSPEFRRPKREDEGGRPTREISSVMMTTSGFLSPAREGKLPEAKAPVPPPPPEQSSSQSTPTGDGTLKKKEKRKEKIGKELFRPTEEKTAKKVPTMKDFVKMKQKVAASNAAAAAANAASATSASIVSPSAPSAAGNQYVSQQMSPIAQVSDSKVNVPNVQKALKDKFDKALAAAKAKTEKLNTTITPIPAVSTPTAYQPIEKLFNEPDKKKVNIFKKISNVKEGKVKKDSRANTPNMMMEEDIVNKIALSRDITIEPINPGLQHKSDKFDFFDDGAVPPTGIHRSPDMLNTGMPIQKEKRKRKDTRKVKRPKKNQNYIGTDIMDIGMMEGQKNADALLSNRLHQSSHMGLPSMHPGQLPFPFLANFSGPGLIPPPLTSPLNTPLFPFSHLGTFGKNPYFPSVPQNISPQAEPISLLSPKSRDPVELIQTDGINKQSPKITPPKMSATPKTTPNTKVTQSPKTTPPLKSSPKSTAPIHIPDSAVNAMNITPQTATPLPIPVSKDVISHDTTEIKDKKIKEHKKEKKDKIKKKNKKDKVKEKSEKKKLKELKKDNKEKMKKEKKIKKKEEKEMREVKEQSENPIPKILLKVNSPSPRPETPESVKKLNIKPVIRKEDDSIGDPNKREPSPGGLAKISALVTGPPKPKTSHSPVIPAIVEKPSDEAQPAPIQKQSVKPKVSPVKIKQHKPKKTEQTFKKVDELGNVVWICPACGQQDDGRPMIGCDGCDAWYHWVCVGIQVPPDENENWYCKPCLCKKNEDLQSDKKRKRKKKEKKDQ